MIQICFGVGVLERDLNALDKIDAVERHIVASRSRTSTSARIE